MNGFLIFVFSIYVIDHAFPFCNVELSVRFCENTLLDMKLMVNS
jgi:hypothetical protein